MAQKTSKIKRLFTIIAGLIVVFSFLPLFLILVFNMLPTVASYLTEKDINKYRTKATGFPNFLGVFVVALPLLRYEGLQTIENAFEIISDPNNALLPYSLAALGWLLTFIIPKLLRVGLAKQQIRKEKYLLDKREKLMRLWGDEVTRDAPEDLTQDDIKKMVARANMALKSAERRAKENDKQ